MTCNALACQAHSPSCSHVSDCKGSAAHSTVGVGGGVENRSEMGRMLGEHGLSHAATHEGASDEDGQEWMAASALHEIRTTVESFS